MGTRLIVNADDYALDDAVDDAILQLAERGAVSATSAMVLSPRWPDAAARLAGTSISKGLHLDLTSPFAETPYADKPVSRLIAAAFTRRLSQDAVRETVDRQLALFSGAMGHPPHFVDGHHHVHHLPVVRGVLIEALETRYGAAAKEIRLRSCVARRWRGAKAAIIAGTGAYELEKTGARRGFRLNTDFIGSYDFKKNEDLPRLWRQWLGSLQGEEPLAMCHVSTGRNPDSGGDAIRPARIREYQWLASSEFRELCDEFSMKPVPWRHH